MTRDLGPGIIAVMSRVPAGIRAVETPATRLAPGGEVSARLNVLRLEHGIAGRRAVRRVAPPEAAQLERRV